jgi:hypothetical protein
MAAKGVSARRLRLAHCAGHFPPLMGFHPPKGAGL